MNDSDDITGQDRIYGQHIGDWALNGDQGWMIEAHLRHYLG